MFEGIQMFCKTKGRLDQHCYKEMLQGDMIGRVIKYDLNPTFMIFQ